MAEFIDTTVTVTNPRRIDAHPAHNVTVRYWPGHPDSVSVYVNGYMLNKYKTAAGVQNAIARHRTTEYGDLSERLTRAGITHVVEETGGGFQAIVVPTPANGGVYAISTEKHDGVWWLCFYPDNTWNESGEPELEADHTIASLMTFLAPLGQTEDQQVAAAVARSKKEIVADIVKGTLPTTVSTFSQLHDYVDANTYGGLCDGVIDLSTNVPNRVQEQVHQWLVAGRPTG